MPGPLCHAGEQLQRDKQVTRQKDFWGQTGSEHRASLSCLSIILYHWLSLVREGSHPSQSQSRMWPCQTLRCASAL
jgi:hypothetical protein